jgi:phosphatidylserine decarboxylase
MANALAPASRISFSAQEDLNFLLTNRIPRALATRLMGRFSPQSSYNRWYGTCRSATWPLLRQTSRCTRRRTPPISGSLHDCFFPSASG